MPAVRDLFLVLPLRVIPSALVKTNCPYGALPFLLSLGLKSYLLVSFVTVQ